MLCSENKLDQTSQDLNPDTSTYWVGHGTIYLTSLNLSFLICKVKRVMIPNLQISRAKGLA